LSGRDKELIRNLEARMKETALAENFEAAANIRDRIYALKAATQSQRIISSRMEDRDIVAVAKEGSAADIQALFIRKGKIIGRKDFYFADALYMPEGELLANFINQFYTGGKEVPPEVLVSHELPERGLAEDFLREMRGKNVSLYSPHRGHGRQVMEMALDNARESLRQNLETQSGRELTLMALKSELRLKHVPRRIEAFDISNTGGMEACGSMVSFEMCQPRKSGYRHFNIKTVTEANDFAMMKEVVTRRYKRLKEEGAEWPDLIMVDGGKGQLSAAVEALGDIGADLDKIDIVGLAKAREKGLKFGGGIREASSYERVYKPEEQEPRILSPTSAAVNLLAAVRDESHRFAITQHRKLRHKKGFKSPLDDIGGVGKKRKTQLLRHFGSFRAIREATVGDLEKVPKLPKKVAEEIFNRLNERGKEAGGPI
ncbi:MAG: excinuclease ABC subunit UvrC, partial [Nitrospirota bacterium]